MELQIATWNVREGMEENMNELLDVMDDRDLNVTYVYVSYVLRPSAWAMTQSIYKHDVCGIQIHMNLNIFKFFRF